MIPNADLINMTQGDWLEKIKEVKAGFMMKPEEFYETGKDWGKKFLNLNIIRKGDKVLDLGCGNGRIAIGLEDANIHYLGIDCVKESIEFCQKNLPQFKFQHQDTWNSFYNPQGKVSPFDFALPKNEFDVVIALSVWTHLEDLKTAKHYIKQVYESLKPEGRFYVTWFRCPPNNISYTAERTVFTEADIVNMTQGFKWIFTEAGYTDSWHNQWNVLLQKCTS